MSHEMYREFLIEEEKFLKQVERNIRDQLNKLKVEELSLLKLISTSDPLQYSNQREEVAADSHKFRIVQMEREDTDDDDLPIVNLNKNHSLTKANSSESDFHMTNTDVNNDTQLKLESVTSRSCSGGGTITPVNLSNVPDLSQTASDATPNSTPMDFPLESHRGNSVDSAFIFATSETTTTVNLDSMEDIQNDLVVNSIPLDLNSTLTTALQHSADTVEEDVVVSETDEVEEEDEDEDGLGA